ncbi:MAG: M15 family metallopeptidase, partial [Prochlorococcus sp.]
ALQEVIDVVGRFWAPPSLEPHTPPPHSTGAAVDLTLADSKGMPLNMGGEIDAIGDISEPNYYAEAAIAESESQAYLWHHRRRVLAEAMLKVGFSQHPNEWWHFSFGDQLWAWRNGVAEAIYGACSEPDSKSTTACSPSLLT